MAWYMIMLVMEVELSLVFKKMATRMVFGTFFMKMDKLVWKIFISMESL